MTACRYFLDSQLPWAEQQISCFYVRVCA